MQFAQPQIATLLSEYQAWEGGLSAFCEYARNELALPYGRGFITSVLVAAGLYRPTPRNAPHQAPWSRGSLRADFPGQQWFGDGKQLRVILCGRSQLFNLEAMVDGASNAVVGVRVTDAEDASAVVQTFEQGLQTTQGQPPLAVTLDNRPSNFSPQIDQALSCTELLRATPGRGEAKAPVEGAFGLFEQSLPGTLIFEASTTRELMRVIAQKVAHAFFAGRNGRPRARLGGKSPAQAYDEANPCAEQIESAKSWIEQLRRKELIARQSREQRADPVRRQLLAEQLAALGLEDSGGQFALSLSGFALGAILHGIAIFRSKKELGSLPIECDPYRYLAGIIRNIDTSDHLERQANHLLELRLRAGDLQRAPLVVQAQSLRQSLSAPQAVREFVSRALSSTSVLEFRFWTSESKSCLASLPTDQATALFPHLARVITSTFKTDRRRRERLIATLAEAVAPVAA